MSRLSLYTSFTARAFVKPHLLENLIEYLVTNKYVFIDDAATHQLLSSKILLTSTITELSSQIIQSGKDQVFSFISVKPKEVSIPELLTLRSLPLDMLQAEAVIRPEISGVMLSQPSMHEKIILNITPFIQSSTGLLSDGIGFHSALVRDALCRSYFMGGKTTWISPDFTQFVSKVYSIAMGTSIARRYRLDVKSLNNITFFFALFYLQMMSDEHNAIGAMRSQWKKFLVPDPTDQEQLYDWMNSIIGKRVPTSLDEVLLLVNRLGNTRVNVDRASLIRMMQSVLTSDVLAASMSLEYPPFLVHLILQVFSGMPIALNYLMKSTGLNKSRQEFEDSILRSHAFVDSLT